MPIKYLILNKFNRGLIYVKFIDSQGEVSTFSREKQTAWRHKNIITSCGINDFFVIHWNTEP